MKKQGILENEGDFLQILSLLRVNNANPNSFNIQTIAEHHGIIITTPDREMMLKYSFKLMGKAWVAPSYNDLISGQALCKLNYPHTNYWGRVQDRLRDSTARLPIKSIL